MHQGIIELAKRDVVLSELIDTYPAPTFQPHTDYYHELIQSIIGQQLSVKAAQTIRDRFVDSFGHMPSPEELLGRNDTELRAVGLSGQKTRYIKDLATRVLTGQLKFDHFVDLTNEQIVAELTAVKGVGEWTAHMFLIFCMGRLDVLPTGDLGIKNAARLLYDLPTMPTPDEMLALAESHGWHPYQSIVSWYLWQSLDNKPITTM